MILPVEQPPVETASHYLWDATGFLGVPTTLLQFKDDGVKGPGARQFSARLWNVPLSVDWKTAAEHAPAVIKDSTSTGPRALWTRVFWVSGGSSTSATRVTFRTGIGATWEGTVDDAVEFLVRAEREAGITHALVESLNIAEDVDQGLDIVERVVHQGP